MTRLGSDPKWRVWSTVSHVSPTSFNDFKDETSASGWRVKLKLFNLFVDEVEAFVLDRNSVWPFGWQS